MGGNTKTYVYSSPAKFIVFSSLENSPLLKRWLASRKSLTVTIGLWTCGEIEETPAAIFNDR